VEKVVLNKLLKFAVVGALGTIVNEGIYVYASKVIPISIALALGIELSLIFNFFLNDIWTFRDKRVGTFIKRMVKFHGSSYLGNVIQYVVALVLLIYMLHYTSLSQVITIIFFVKQISANTLILTNFLGILAGFLVRFVTSYKYVWA